MAGEIDYTDTLEHISDSVDALLNNQLAIATALQDMANSTQSLGRLLCWTDVILVVILVALMLALGFFMGYQVTKYLRTRNADG